MIKILNAYETAPHDEQPSKLHVDIEVDGYPWVVGGLPITMTTSELNDYLSANEADMLRQAILKLPKETYPKPRYDLGHELPHSEHIGRLIAVNPALGKPATVRRRYLGKDYDIQCLVSQAIVNMWTATPKEVNIGDYVLVSFIEETPNEIERNVAIVTDKVFKSW